MALVRVVSSCLQRLVPTSKAILRDCDREFPLRAHFGRRWRGTGLRCKPTDFVKDCVLGNPVLLYRLISRGLERPSSCQTGFRTSQLNTLQLYPFLWSSVNDRTRLLDDLFQPIIVLRRFDDYGYCCGHLARPWCQRTHHRHRRLDHDYPSFVLPGALVRPHPSRGPINRLDRAPIPRFVG